MTEYPFDTEALAKGSEVTAAEIERAFGVRRGTAKFQLAILKAKEYVVRRLGERGVVATVVQRDDGLAILTDNEQVDYNAEQFTAGVRKSRRAHARMLGADRSQITKPEALAKHDRRIEVQGRALSAIGRELRIPAPRPVERLTPGSKAPQSG